MNSTPIVILGFGNLGYHLLKLFWENGFRNISIVSNQPLIGEHITWHYNLDNTEFESDFSIKLGEDISVYPRSNLTDNSYVFSDEAIVFLCVNDDQIGDSLKYLENFDSQRVILSGGFQFVDGTIPSKVSVVYPLYSFVKSMDIDWKVVPIFVESPSQTVVEILRDLHLEQITYLNSEQRNLLHVAAVFANNFTNAIFIAAQEVLQLSPELKMEFLLPIIQQTIDKLKLNNALDIQTGPAKRGDLQTIKRHEHLLNGLASEQKLYLAVTEYIRSKLNLM